jgi:hypothetical protein
MSTQKAFEKLEYLIESSPSVIRIGTMILPLRIISSILWPLLFFGSLGIVIFCIWAIDIKEHYNLTANDLQFGFVIGVLGLFAGILFWIISRLCKLVRNRNYFILEVIDLVDEMKKEMEDKRAA